MPPDLRSLAISLTGIQDDGTDRNVSLSIPRKGGHSDDPGTIIFEGHPYGTSIYGYLIRARQLYPKPLVRAGQPSCRSEPYHRCPTSLVLVGCGLGVSQGICILTACRNLECTLLYAVTQLVMWLSKSEFDAPLLEKDDPQAVEVVQRTDGFKDQGPRHSLSLGVQGETDGDHPRQIGY